MSGIAVLGLLANVSPDAGKKSTFGGIKDGKKFSNAVSKLKKFRTTAKVVTAMNRFRRGPLNTILNMPQEQAMQIIVEKHIDENERDKKVLHSCLSGKVAKQCQNVKHKEHEMKMKPKREMMEKIKTEAEQIDQLYSCVCHLLPVEEENQ